MMVERRMGKINVVEMPALQNEDNRKEKPVYVVNMMEIGPECL